MIGCKYKGCISLTKVSMPETITEIGDEVFASCRALSQIVLPKDLTEIGTSAF
ncbi:leucine-rich repeat protein, partial [Bacteroides heparinolyticus]|uniref:leucine-rich repeat protein n=1 Tax=Prevotella heparinolytica TaxID=28113 RepID=UPI0035A0D39A